MGWITDLFEGIPLTSELIAKLESIEAQLAVLEPENVQLRIETERLKEQITEIERAKQQLKQENQDLRKTREFPHLDPLRPIEAPKKKALLALALRGMHTPVGLLKEMGISDETGAPHLKQLMEEGYIELPPLGTTVRYWKITMKGRELLASHLLI